MYSGYEQRVRFRNDGFFSDNCLSLAVQSRCLSTLPAPIHDSRNLVIPGPQLPYRYPHIKRYEISR